MRVLSEKEYEDTIILNADDGEKYTACGWVVEHKCPREMYSCDKCGAHDTGLLTYAEARRFWRNFKPKKGV